MPVLGLSIYGAFVPREIGGWNLLSLGFMLTASGSLLLYWMTVRWEVSLKIADGNVESDIKGCEVDLIEYESVQRLLAEAQQSQMQSLSEVDRLNEQIQKLSLTNRDMAYQSEKMQIELDQTKRTAKHQSDLQQNQIWELQEIIAEHRAFSEKKQQQMLHLETKVGDLKTEIKTLLQPEEIAAQSLPPPSSFEDYAIEKNISGVQIEIPLEIKAVDSVQEASRQLRQCLDIATKIKGSQRFGSQIYSFMDSPADSFSLDLRRLCDRLRSEAQSIILLYSPKDNHLLFASNQIKALTGWSSDKFVQNFSEILDEAEWKHGVSSLAMTTEVQTKLRLKTKSNQDLSVNVNLGMIPNGIFRNHVIAVLSN